MKIQSKLWKFHINIISLS